MKALVIGYGSIGKRHIENLSKYFRVDVIVVSKRKNDKFLKKHNCTLVNSIEEGIKLQPDFAIISNESSLHVKTALKLTKYNIDFFIEKPLSHNMSEAINLTKILQRKKLITLIGCNLRFHPCFIKMKKVISQKKLGKIILVQSENSSYLPDWHHGENYSKSYAARKDLGGGVVLTCIHEIDYLYWLFGPITNIFSFTGKFSNLKVNTSDLSAILFKFKNNIVGELHLDYFQQPSSRTCKIVGTKGTLLCDYKKNNLKFFNLKTKKWIKIFESNNYDTNTMYVDELCHFIDSVLKRKKTINPVDEGLKTLKIADSVLRSSQLKKMIKL